MKLCIVFLTLNIILLSYIEQYLWLTEHMRKSRCVLQNYRIVCGTYLSGPMANMNSVKFHLEKLLRWELGALTGVYQDAYTLVLLKHTN